MGIADKTRKVKSINLSEFAYNDSKPDMNKIQRLKKIEKLKVESEQQLLPLTDILANDLKLVFIGYNPSVKSSQVQHRYAHHTNTFWKLLSASGIVGDKVVTYEDDIKLPTEFSIGFTDLVMRPSKNIQDLSNSEMRKSVPLLLEKLQKFKPAIVCFVGKGIWDHILKVIGIKEQNKFEWGLQSQRFYEGKVFVLPSTSGLVRISWDDKLLLWKDLAKLYNMEDNQSDYDNEHNNDNE